METYFEKAKEIPVRGHYDVIVAGGGTAGFAAAIAAARRGSKTLVVERMACLGGQITAGIMGIICDINDQEKIIIKGIPLEFVNDLWDRGGINKRDKENKPVNERDFTKAEFINYDPEIAKGLVNDYILREKNLTVLLETWVADAIMDGDKVVGIVVENKSGRSAYYGKCIIDATADADVCAFAGAEFMPFSPEEVHPVSLIAQIGGIDKEAFFDFYNEHPEWRDTFPTDTAWEPGVFHKLGIDNEVEGVELPPELEYLRHWCIIIHDSPVENVMHLNMTGEAQVDGTNAEEISKSIITSRKRISECLEVMKKVVPGWENGYVYATASMLGVRESRQIVGEYTITEDDIFGYHRFADALCSISGGIGVHTSDGQWVDMSAPPSGTSYDIPLRSMLPIKINGLIVAGRCLSANHVAMGTVRTIGPCLAMGQGAAIAASLAIELGVEPRDIPSDKLQKALIEQGVNLEGIN